MAFSLSGYLSPSTNERTVTWDEGDLTGDEILVYEFQRAAAKYDGIRVGPPEGPVTLHNHLASDVSTLLLAERVFLGPFTTTGAVPVVTTSEGAE